MKHSIDPHLEAANALLSIYTNPVDSTKAGGSDSLQLPSHSDSANPGHFPKPDGPTPLKVSAPHQDTTPSTQVMTSGSPEADTDCVWTWNK